MKFRTDIPPKSTVIGRYSVLPFYSELEKELRSQQSSLINTKRQHDFIANMDWYEQIDKNTPATYKNKGWLNVPSTEYGYVVKGMTNSRKFRWDTHMFAPDRDSLKCVLNRLHDDAMLSDQGLVIREYVPLREFEQGINGLPITNEWRFFCLGDKVLIGGFYWSIAECAPDMTQIPPQAQALAEWTAEKLHGWSKWTNFFVVDIAETADGEWIVIEVNDGQMSGLSMIEAEEFYLTLKSAL